MDSLKGLCFLMNINEYQNYHETKAHTSTEFPYNTYLCSIPLDFPGVPLHWHDEMELVVIKKGQGSRFELSMSNLCWHGFAR